MKNFLKNNLSTGISVKGISALAFVISLSAVTVMADNDRVVFLSAGQSNTDGRTPLTDSGTPQYVLEKNPYCNIFYQTPYNKKELGKCYVLHYGKSGNPQRWTYDATLFHVYATTVQQPFYVIKTSYGGTSISPFAACSPNSLPSGMNAWTKGYAKGYHWSADSTFLADTEIAGQPLLLPNDNTKYCGQSMLKAFIANIDASLQSIQAVGDTPDIKCLLWHQGCSDRSKEPASKYAENFMQMITFIRQHLVEVTGNPSYASLPVVLGTVPKASKQYSAEVEKQMYSIEKMDDNIHVVDLGSITLLSDRLHFNAPGAIEAGKRYYATLEKYGLVPTPNAEPSALYPIADSNIQKTANTAVYNILGQKVNVNSKGIVIINGRKYFSQ